MTLQQRENTVYNTSWYTALEDANVTNNTAGPLTVLTKLEEVTSVWENVNDQKYSMGKTLFIDSAYTSCTTAVGQIYSCSSSTYNLNERVSKARMITAQEVNTTGCLGGAAKTCPIWMYNYLNNSTAYDGTVNDNTVDVNGNYNVSYWTMSNSSANGQLAWTVNETGHTWAKAIASLNVGSRAVVVINK